ncbi:MAG: hypothetical protein KF836_07255 [Fimbriimonadaceae bacterium]|nr:hypothetical protein [Fimbriimonadaceae bacterium]
MANVVYKPAEVMHWFDTESKRTNAIARAQTKDIAKTANEEGFLPGLKQAAGAALSIGKGAYGTVIQKQATETRIDLYETGFEVNELTRRVKIGYDQVRQIVSKANDRYLVLYNGGNITIKPVAHLVAGRYRVPVGWLRNGTEVPFIVLIEEISARSGVEIIAE